MLATRLTEVGFIPVLILSLAGMASAERDKSHKEADSMPGQVRVATLGNDPLATDKGLKTLVTSLRPTVRAHLSGPEALKSALKAKE